MSIYGNHEHHGEDALIKAQFENALIKAEVERLRKFNEEALAHIAKEERKSRERLDMAQAEVERLTKAGDRLAELSDTTIWWEKVKKGKQP